jgi:hypothetical protein
MYTYIYVAVYIFFQENKSLEYLTVSHEPSHTVRLSHPHQNIEHNTPSH